jgi:tetratricopeptide (TPR) repeat protein
MMYAIALSALDRDKEALALIEDAYHTFDRTLGPEHPRTLQAGQTYAIHLYNLDRFAEQAALMQELAPRMAKVFGERSPRYARTLTWYGVAQAHGPDPASAVPTLQHALEIFDAAPALDDLGSPNTLQTLGETYEKIDKNELAVDAYRRMLVRAAERPSSVPVDDGKRPVILARLLLDMRRYDGVQELIEQARQSAGTGDAERRIVGAIDLAQARLSAAKGKRVRAVACARSATMILAKYDYAKDEHDQAQALLVQLEPTQTTDTSTNAHAQCMSSE